MNSNGSSQQSSQNRDSISQQNSSSQNTPQPQPQTIQLRFNKILIQADQLMAKQQYPEAVTKLNLLTEKINVQHCTFYRIQFLKQNKKEYDKKLELVCLYNLASAYHKQWILDECIPLVDRFLIMLKATIQQEEIKTKSHYWYKMKHLLIKTQLQYCAILSQVGDHYKALKIAIEVSESLKQFFTKGHNEVCRFLNKIHKIDSKKSLASSWGSDAYLNPQTINNDKVEFATNVLLQSKDNLGQLLKIETYEEVVKENFTKISQQLVDLKSRTYFWKNNPQNNIKLLRKQLDQHKQIKPGSLNSGNDSDGQERNLLGIKKSKSWIEQITIAKIMVMSPINYLEFAEKDNIIFEFNYKNLVDKVCLFVTGFQIILVSVTYFSLAIQLRFIETSEKIEKEKKDQQQAGNGLTQSNSEKHIVKRQSIQQDKQMKKSQVFHLKSVILLCKLIKENSAFLNHLVMNYHKHYKQDLITIQEESSMAEYSHIYDKRSKTNSLFMKNNMYDNNNINQFILPEEDDQEEDQEEGDILSPSNKFPRGSAYFEGHEEGEKVTQKKELNISNGKKTPLMVFKKANPKKDFDISDQKSMKKYTNSISISRNEALNKDSKTSRYPKYINQKDTLQDRTMKKMSVGKIIALGSPGKLGIQTDRQKDRSTDRETSLSKFHSMRSLEKKSFSTRSIPSFSLGKISMNSTTLKHKKRRGEKSPDKEKFKLKDLKESNEFKKADFKKKEKQADTEKVPTKIKDKKKEKLNNGLTLLKQSSSNPNLRTGLMANEYNLEEYGSIKEKSRKMDKNTNKR